MEYLQFLQGLRFPLLTELMLLITRLGEETAFLVMGLIVFWCVDKYRGYYLLGVGLLGNLSNQFLKITCRVPRPWTRGGDFHAVESAKAAAGGYSFPSGHTQTAVGTFVALAATSKRRITVIVCLCLAALVGFSRNYLGVHYLSDVLVGAGMALGLIALLSPMTGKRGKAWTPRVFAAGIILSGAFLAYVELFPFPADLDMENYASAMKNAYTFLGCFSGVLLVWFADEKKLRFSTRAVWWAQILKTVLGLVLVLLVKEGLRSPLDALFGGHMLARAVRYFLIVVAAGIVWPMSFTWFARLGRKEEV